VPKSLSAKFSIYRTKSGPNGHALATSIQDARALPDSLILSLTRMGGPKVGYTLETAMKCVPFLDFLSSWCKTSVGKSFRRLSYFSDKEGKTRLIGIMDYYSQIVLKPLHTYLANTLKKIPQDCTFDQTKFKKILKGSKVFYSVDLSNATDRFPITLIEKLLKAQLPASYVDAWRDVMVGYPFDFNRESKLYYSVGNPMGAYSFFNSFALTHHYIIYYCCRLLKKN